MNFFVGFDKSMNYSIINRFKLQYFRLQISCNLSSSKIGESGGFGTFSLFFFVNSMNDEIDDSPDAARASSYLFHYMIFTAYFKLIIVKNMSSFPLTKKSRILYTRLVNKKPHRQLAWAIEKLDMIAYFYGILWRHWAEKKFLM